ncbi:MAG: DNA repair protein RecO [Gammaproteobacteria bacterium]|nr:MAG: DNA repair protein RecO [Gammaproteobacteria bacterium]
MTTSAGERGFILHSRPYSETSALVDILTASQGRIRAVARGARRKGQQPLQPFCEFWLNWHGRSDLKTLRQAESSGRVYRLLGDALYAGLYANELLVRLLEPEAPSVMLFSAYSRLLEQLADAPRNLSPALRALEGALLAELGYGQDVLAHEAGGAPLNTDRFYRWDWTQGWLPAPDGTGYPGSVLLAMAQGDYSDPALEKWARRLYREWLDSLLGSRPLRSRELYKAYKEKQHASSRPARGQH